MYVQSGMVDKGLQVSRRLKPRNWWSGEPILRCSAGSLNWMPRPVGGSLRRALAEALGDPRTSWPGTLPEAE